MGSASSPSKKAPAKRAGSAKPNKPSKPRASRSKQANSGGAKSSKTEPVVPPAAAAAALRIPTNLPVCIIDNGGWTVKYGLAPPPQATGDNVSVEEGKIAKDAGVDIADQGNGTDNNSNVVSGHARNNNINNVKMSSMYNATARPPHQLAVLAGDEITTRMKNLGQLSWNYPLERGMICDGETQLRVWARVLEALSVVPVPMMVSSGRSTGGGFLAAMGATARRVKPSAVVEPTRQTPTYSSNNCTFLLLEPPFVPSVISEGVDCMLFRELGMARVARMLGPCMAAVRYNLSFGESITTDNAERLINDNTKCCCVVDSGYSFTHVVPTHRGEALTNAIRRLNVGGKVLTNLLKESVTYRQWNMMDEYHIVNDAKEQLCFVSQQFDQEMKQARATRKGLRWFDREYLLPDFVNTFRGSVRLPEPLQRKREMEEMEKIKKEMDRLNDEKQRKELEDEANDLSRMQTEEKAADELKIAESSSLQSKQGKKGKGHKTKKEKKRKSKKGSAARDSGKDESDHDNDDSDNDSDEESDQQRLKRLKAMREAERKRREQESLERQALAMSVERFAIPEVFFRPSDIGLDCGGIAESIVESIEACDPILRAAMYHNVLLIGGNVKIPGFRERVESELRKLAPTNYELRVYSPDDPISYAWEGAKQFASLPGFQEHFSVDRLSWETMKKAGKNQGEIWGNNIYNSIVQNV